MMYTIHTIHHNCKSLQ